MTNIERLERCADIMRRRWIYDPEAGLLFSRETQDVIKGGMTSKGHLVVSIQEGDFKVTLTYQKACYVYTYGAYDETLFEVHHINLNKQDNRLRNIRLMPKEIHRRIHRNVRRLIQWNLTQFIQPEAIEQSL
ncbi:TPA: HNH endonuclease [Escherichia coli]|uniref:HNH endonuclease n=1 Tax=Escherichia coli TaxID=562 RepID=UPI001C9A7769|nr:HNH endonuclease [Escherichia coli]MBY7241354.1 HNH endonuclease [Escherichia coli]HAW2878748.1 HNH endonuclease [Escherichia coli]